VIVILSPSFLISFYYSKHKNASILKKSLQKKEIYGTIYSAVILITADKMIDMKI
jgi:hypothetical protein